MTFDNWCDFQWEEDYLQGLRVGQSYLNNVRPGIPYPELYYCTDVEKAWDMIYKMEEENEQAT